MKKSNILFVLLFAAGTSFAQIEVLPNGNVGIGTPPNSSFSEHWQTHINAPDRAVGLNVQRTGGRPTGFLLPPQISAISAHSSLTASATANIGITGLASSTTNSGIAIGVHGMASGGSNGRNFGVFGERTFVTGYGAGIVGSSAANMGFANTPFIPGFYAGFFEGNVRINGTLNGLPITNSDIRFKQNILPLGGNGNMEEANELSSRPTSVLDNLMLLNPVQYNLQQVFFDPDESRSLEERAFFDEESQLFQKTHFGFIAQELREVFPNLVFEDDIGWLAINYTGMIPLLLQGMKDLKAIIEAQNARIEQLERGLIGIPAPPPIQTMSAPALASNDDWTSFDETAGRTAALYQNAPNPFRQATEIRFYLPQTVATAFLIFYDLQGRQLHQITLTQRGEGAELIQGSQFAPGIYLYALIADGQAIAVKQMIITE